MISSIKYTIFTSMGLVEYNSETNAYQVLLSMKNETFS